MESMYVLSVGLGVFLGVVNGLVSFRMLKRAATLPVSRFQIWVFGGMAIRIPLLLLIVVLVLLLLPGILPVPFVIAATVSVLGGIFFDAFYISRQIRQNQSKSTVDSDES